MFRILTAFVTIGLLSGCMKPLEITSEPVDFSRVKSATAPKVVAVDTTPVRTYLKNEEDKRVEVAGAACTATSSQFRASFKSPANLRFPRTKGKPTPMTMTCKANGKTVSAVLHPGLYANYVGVTSSTHPGPAILATLVIAAATHGVAQERDHWTFVRGDPKSGLHALME